MAYPNSLDALTNPTSGDQLSNPPHATQHADANNAIEAIEAELGTLPKGGSASVKDRLDTLDTTDASHLSRINAIESAAGGTSFPVSPASGDRFYRTDRHLLYYYDGTRWLSVTLFTHFVAQQDAVSPISATGIIARGLIPYPGTIQVYIEKVFLVFYVVAGTALSGSHKWVVTVVRDPSTTNIATFSIDTGSLNTWRNFTPVDVNATAPTTDFAINATGTKTGTPGNLYAFVSISYRLVG